MALCEPVLRVRAEDIEAGHVWVAERNGRIVGTIGILPDETGESAELDKVFVQPEAIGGGVGAALMAQAVAATRALGIGKLEILSDPHAAGFYEKFGAVRIGEAPSDAIPGRLLPRYELRLDGECQDTRSSS